MNELLQQLASLLSVLAGWFAQVGDIVPVLVEEITERGVQMSATLLPATTVLSGLSAIGAGVFARASRDDVAAVGMLLSVLAGLGAGITGALYLSYLSESYAPGYTLFHSIWS